MLIATVRQQQAIVVETPAGPVVLRVMKTRNGKARIGIEAPASWPVTIDTATEGEDITKSC